MRFRAKPEVMCRRCERNCQVFPFVLVVCLEEKSETWESETVVIDAA